MLSWLVFGSVLGVVLVFVLIGSWVGLHGLICGDLGG